MVAEKELLLCNATVRTMAGLETAEALLIRGDRIACVGSEKDCRAEGTGALQIIDLEGATVLPGFVDAHCHPLMYGQFASWVDCSWEAAPSIDSVVSALQARAAQHPSAPIRGHGFHHGNVAEQRMLTKDDLNRVSTTREVLVFHSSGHGAIVNSWTLIAAGVNEHTPDPVGGHFGRNSAGQLTGEVWDAAADWLTGTLGVKIANNGPNFHIPDEPDTLVEHLAVAQRELHSMGVTTVADAQVTSRELQTYLRLRRQSGLTMRVEMLIISSLLSEIEALGLGGRLGDDQLAFAGIKLYADGALTAGTARFEDAYCCGGENVGYLYHEPHELADLVLRAAGLGLQTATHAQGDAAIEIVLDAHAKVRKAGNNTVRHRIEHFGGPTPAQVERAAELQLWPVTQPQYVRRYGDELAHSLGKRADRIAPLGELRAAGLPLVLSSDAPVCPPDPLEAVYSAVTRRTLSGKVLGSEDQCLTVGEALTAHTLGAAASVHREEEIGSLEAGKFADLVVLSADPVTVLPSDLLNIKVRQTWVGGSIVFDSNNTKEQNNK
ncbi:amidohydrolase [uncultured Kocuria sp.]|uniref:amidohydrolase n=1 Tax=uncultured Kocuria sp. TaxID=259305 RepID=UPI002603D64B|nr:amidohydrolase [uncultured Kocuria sp.]